MTTKFLFPSKISRPDILGVVKFLTTIVNGIDMEYYKKLGRVIKYLRGDPEMPLSLEVYNAHIMKWWVGTSFSVQPDMKRHTVDTMSIGKVSIY